MHFSSVVAIMRRHALLFALFLALSSPVAAFGAKKVSLYITAYDANCKRCGTGHYTRYRTLASRGGVAADPRYYPPGTKFKINGRWYTMDDTGGFIKGPRHIDLRLRTHAEAQCWGRHRITIEVEKPHAKTRRTNHTHVRRYKTRRP